MGDSYTSLVFHIVFSTKGRGPWLVGQVVDEVYARIAGILKWRRGKMLAIGGMPDHVHVLASLPASLAVSTVVRDMKSRSSALVNELGLINIPFRWQTGYSAFSVSRSHIPKVRTYIENQEEHHSTRAYPDELVALLERHEIPFDPRYLQ